MISVLRLTGENKNKLVMKLVAKGEQNLLTGSLLPNKIRKSNLQHAVRFSMEVALPEATSIVEFPNRAPRQIISRTSTSKYFTHFTY